jgi:hypothetical protein
MGRYGKFHVIIFLSHILHWFFSSLYFYIAEKIFELTNCKNKSLRVLPLFNLQIFLFCVWFVINRLWHEIFHIVPGISHRPISALQLRCQAWYGSLGLIPGPICKMSCQWRWKVFVKSTQDVDIWIEIPIQHDVYIWANYSVSTYLNFIPIFWNIILCISL